jgi:hypothetical protein
VVERLVPSVVLPRVDGGVQPAMPVRQLPVVVVVVFITARLHSPFLRRRHGIDVASKEVPVPGYRADGEDRGSRRQSLRFPRRRRFLGSRAGRGSRTLQGPIRQHRH